MTARLLPFLRQLPPSSVLSCLEQTPYDELIAIDPDTQTYRYLFSVQGKYQIPAQKGQFQHLFDYALDRLIHPDDRERYAAFMDLPSLLKRLNSAGGEGPAGMLETEFRIRLEQGRWNWVQQIIVGGEAYPDLAGACHCYVYDIQNIKDREAGLTRVAPAREKTVDPLTGLQRDKDFLASADELLRGGRAGWTMLVIDLEHFKLFNDWYGRDVGDMVLARIGTGLRLDAEKCDGLAGYFGDDDFCLLFPEGQLDIDGLFSRLHRAIRRYGVSVGFRRKPL